MSDDFFDLPRDERQAELLAIEAWVNAEVLSQDRFQDRRAANATASKAEAEKLIGETLTKIALGAPAEHAAKMRLKTARAAYKAACASAKDDQDDAPKSSPQLDDLLGQKAELVRAVQDLDRKIDLLDIQITAERAPILARWHDAVAKRRDARESPDVALTRAEKDAAMADPIQMEQTALRATLAFGRANLQAAVKADAEARTPLPGTPVRLALAGIAEARPIYLRKEYRILADELADQPELAARLRSTADRMEKAAIRLLKGEQYKDAQKP